MAQAANMKYDFERFTDKPLRVAAQRGVKRKVRRYADGMRWMGRVAAAALALTLIFCVLYSEAQVTELTGEIQKEQAAMSQAQNDYNYLIGRLNELSSLSNIDERAREIGLVRAQPENISYVVLEQASRVELPRSGADRLLDKVGSGLLSAFEYLAP